MRRAEPTQIGQMRDRIQIHAPTHSTAANGEKTLAWTLVATVWATVEEVAGSESVAERQTQAEVISRITVRYRSDINAKCRVTFDGKISNIESALNIDGKKRFLELLCRRKEG